ncbi:hypothetical protein CFP71_28250 [Amycolatopsis thailandensis]|uniref:Uncharacterized protein n=1 Tax=Amycolatopsis thailandensis TaxID=589330 RepID=A0A229RVE3_9PSEU|nr:hypothetical protein CFP71_28250 [Amycolatopsis thailandensis]
MDALWWGGTIALGTWLAIPSIRVPLPTPLWLGLVVTAGVSGAALGCLARSLFLHRPWLRFSTTTLPVAVAVVLIIIGTPSTPDTWPGVPDSRRACVAGTEYADPAVVAITADTVTITGSQGRRLRFTRTGHPSQTPAHAELLPADLETRLALAAFGCDQ